MLQTRTVESGTLGLLKNLTYFDDAEEQADPLVFDLNVRWEMVRAFIENEVQKLYK